MAAKRGYWLIKQEPEKYSWSDLEREGETNWTGVRNFQARNNLRAMKTGDKILFYHSVSEKQVVGVAEVIREAYPDPTGEDSQWSAVDIKPAKRLKNPVSLEMLRKEPDLAEIALIRQSRLSVMPLSKDEFEAIVALGR
jgi:predicted RNA-binding protein with PUA-like domain